jgi:hypothetical protein
MIYHTSHHNPATLPFNSLESLDLVEPFCTFWENTRPSRMTDNMDNRKGWMKGLCYWYWVADAERRGVQIRVPKSIPKYLVVAVGRIGVLGREKRTSMGKERGRTEDVGEVLGTVEGLELEPKGVEMSMAEEKEGRERMKSLSEKLRWLEEMDAKKNGDGQVADGRDTGGREGDNGETGSDEKRERCIRRGNKQRWPVVREDTGSEDSDSDFHPTHAITPPNST